ncbi:MAG: hypothetical protein V8R91_05120 [Butyricimonas faecihominis]
MDEPQGDDLDDRLWRRQVPLPESLKPSDCRDCIHDGGVDA